MLWPDCSQACLLTQSALRSMPSYLLVHRTGLAQGAGKQQSPSRAEASLGVGFASFCKDPQQSASGHLTQIHRSPEGNLHTCQGHAGEPLVPTYKTSNSQHPFCGHPEQARAREKVSRSQSYLMQRLSPHPRLTKTQKKQQGRLPFLRGATGQPLLLRLEPQNLGLLSLPS